MGFSVKPNNPFINPNSLILDCFAIPSRRLLPTVVVQVMDQWDFSHVEQDGGYFVIYYKLTLKYNFEFFDSWLTRPAMVYKAKSGTWYSLLIKRPAQSGGLKVGEIKRVSKIPIPGYSEAIQAQADVAHQAALDASKQLGCVPSGILPGTVVNTLEEGRQVISMERQGEETELSSMDLGHTDPDAELVEASKTTSNIFLKGVRSPSASEQRTNNTLVYDKSGKLIMTLEGKYDKVGVIERLPARVTASDVGRIEYSK